MPVKDWATNDVPTASDFNTQFRDQVISTVTSATRPTGTEGQLIYETDTDLCYLYNGGWVRFGAGGGWTSFTPTLTQSGAVTKTITYAKYEKVGRMVAVSVLLAVTGTGTGNNKVTVSLPFTAAIAGAHYGGGYIADVSSGSPYTAGIVHADTTTTMALIDATQATSVAYLGVTGSVFAAALASGDTVSMSLVYESAS